MNSFRIDVEAIVQEIGNCSTHEQLGSLLKNMREDCGISNAVYHAPSVRGEFGENPVLLLTYHQEWVDKYVESHYFDIDPLVVEGSKAFLPLDWSSVDRTNNRVKEFFEEAEKHEVGNQGMTIPICGPYGEKALFTFSCHRSDSHWEKERYASLSDFQLVGHFVHEQAMRIAGSRVFAEEIELSNRELEFLSLTARGNAVKQISALCEVSGTAVRNGINSAVKKLNCANVSHAVAEAIRLELI